ncbi:MAG: hypothetical protein GTN84_03280 [Hydrogenophaga sp.]|uniref:hypothetical protein n=1 Tax=Hydrogenophaga sp. TaxID=1904254 RepID=UPI0016A4ED71|nr:hypothetical protein [Hydrogenophaga sp.]NIM40234.1 hypothetical protein [Hydrogenophaga sp.]NIN25465.1 hypothetical protein [Hydrogenophaga sp.]NIN30117.1 hypothetical protein [Hydrogenophaga sp.]NIN54418.1 hypothetical protein [Hydrogenophaga sp.]NIO50291.1 hypothetical protein [Hydrogenophaga sp.]
MLVLAGCNGYGHRQFQTGPPVDDWFDVEVDDFGQLWHSEQQSAALDRIKASIAETNTIVVAFAHGWHHNAHTDNQNRTEFKKAVEQVRATLAAPAYIAAREGLGAGKSVRVIGIYLGWRGRSLPGLLDYATFWGRKAAAERVGQGAVREFVLRLNEIYKEANAKDSPRFMGLVFLGHSFGGQVLHRATASVFEDDLVRRDQTIARVMALGAGQERRLAEIPPVSSVGDLVILINPALEAMQFNRIHDLYRQRSYPLTQTPVLTVFSGEADTARQRLFPIGRWFSSLLRPPFRDQRQRDEWLLALGEAEHQRTHTLELNADATPIEWDPQRYCEQVVPMDFTNPRTNVGGALLAPDPRAPHIPYSPVLVAYSGQEIIGAHSGIWEPSFRNFLVDYVALIEGKRLCLRAIAIRALTQRLPNR